MPFNETAPAPLCVYDPEQAVLAATVKRPELLIMIGPELRVVTNAF